MQNLPLFELDLEDQQQVVPPEKTDPRDGTITERALRFHARNPHVYRFAVRVCRYMKARGLKHYGTKAVWEVMRFKYLETTGDIYKLNNNYTAFYSRLIMAQEADLAGFFETRESPHDPEYFAHTPTPPAHRCKACNYPVAEPGLCGECACEDDGDIW
jgi:hypothetical protein